MLVLESFFLFQIAHFPLLALTDVSSRVSHDTVWINFLHNNKIIFCFLSYEEDDVNTVPENSVRPVARTALTWDQVEPLSL